MEQVSKAILETIGGLGYAVMVLPTEVRAIDEKTGERFVVRHDADLFCDAVVELAQQVGIDVTDG